MGTGTIFITGVYKEEIRRAMEKLYDVKVDRAARIRGSVKHFV